jgi:hypothetical protein
LGKHLRVIDQHALLQGLRVDVLVSRLAMFPKLQVLELPNANLLSRHSAELARSLGAGKSPKLTVLRLDHNEIGSEGAIALGQVRGRGDRVVVDRRLRESGCGASIRHSGPGRARVWTP